MSGQSASTTARRWSTLVLVTSWTLAGLAIALVPFTEPSWHLGQWYGLVDTADAIVFGAVASVLLARGGHVVAWLVALCAVGGGLAALGLQWSMLVLVHPDLPDLLALQMAQNWAWVPGTYAMIILVPVLVRRTAMALARAGLRRHRQRGDHRADGDAAHRPVPVAGRWHRDAVGDPQRVVARRPRSHRAGPVRAGLRARCHRDRRSRVALGAADPGRAPRPGLAGGGFRADGRRLHPARAARPRRSTACRNGSRRCSISRRSCSSRPRSSSPCSASGSAVWSSSSAAPPSGACSRASSSSSTR